MENARLFNRNIWGLVLHGLALAGCGSDTGDGGTTPPVDYGQYQSQAATLHNTWDGIAQSDPANLPLSGVANYSGVMTITVETGAGDLGMAGEINLQSNFTTNSLSGNARYFLDENSVAYSGVLAITGGVLDRSAVIGTDDTFSANFGGTITGGGDAFGLSGDLLGDFYGANQGASTGLVAGQAISSFGTGYLFGSFIAEQ